jgi:hypothetical protein
MTRGIRVVVMERGKRSRPHTHDPKVVYVREVVAYNTKWNRAEPVAGLYEAGLAYHDSRGALGSLEDTMTTWEPTPGAMSPNRIDALSQAAHELCDLSGDAPTKTDIKGMLGAQQALARGTRRAPSLSLPRGVGSRI